MTEELFLNSLKNELWDATIKYGQFRCNLTTENTNNSSCSIYRVSFSRYFQRVFVTINKIYEALILIKYSFISQTVRTNVFEISITFIKGNIILKIIDWIE